MKGPRLRALVLAAGQGRRLRPLTSFLPKPLLPVCGRSILERTLGQLAEVGCERVAVNLHHQGEVIRSALGDSAAGLPLTYSVEEQLLGTLGALRPLRQFLDQAEAILVVNGDSLCRWPLKRLVRRHVKGGAAATLLVSRRADPRAFGGGVGVDRHRTLTSLRPGAADEASERRVFMGAHVLSPSLLDRLPEGPSDFIADLYEPLLQEGASIAAVESRRRWHDLGTPERYRRGVLEWAPRGGWRAADIAVGETARVKGSVIEEGVRIAGESVVAESVVLPRARIGAQCRVMASIIGPGVDLPPHTTVERRMVTPVRSDATLPAEASVVGGLVYAPI